MKSYRLIVLGTVLTAVGGCSMAPQYQRPELSVPTTWPATAPATQPAKAVLPAWQDFVADPKLRQVITLALNNNRDLRVAVLNAKRAKLLYGIQQSEQLPVIDAGASMIRQRTPASLSSTGQAMTASQYNVNLGAVAWEIDLFGRIQSLADQALQEYLASAEGSHSVQILLISQVSEAYLTLAADREGLKLAQDTLAAQQDTYNLVKRRVERGQSPDIDLYRAQTQVDTARVAVSKYTQRIALDINALTLLVGASVPADLQPIDLSQVRGFPEIAAGVSSDVLLQRPDILQAEHQLQGANASIGAARAAFFPRISLTAAVGTASSELSGLFKSGSGVWSYAPQVVLPIFDTRTWFALPVSKTDKEIAIANYQKAIQTGFREVADALAVQTNVKEQVVAQEALVGAVSETYRLSRIRYEKGLDSYLDVLDAQRSLFFQQESLITLYLTQRANQTRLFAVLGGGWQVPPPQPKTDAKQNGK